MKPYQDNYTETLNPSLKPLAGTVSRNTAWQPNTLKPPASTTPSLKSMAGASSPQSSPTSSFSQPPSQTSLKSKVAALPQSPFVPRTFSELTQTPKTGTTSRAVYDYAESYRGMPALPAVGKAMSDYGSALKQGAKEFFTPNETYKNFLYGEEPTAFQQAFSQPSTAPQTQPAGGLKAAVFNSEQDKPKVMQKNEQVTPSLRDAVAQLEGVKNILGMPVQQLDEQGFYTVKGENGATAKVLPWTNSNDDALQRTLSADEYNAIQAQNRDYMNQRDTAVIGQSSSYESDGKGGYSSSSSNGDFSPHASGLNIGLRSLQRENQPKYALSDGMIYQQEGQGAEAFNASLQQDRSARTQKILALMDKFNNDPDQNNRSIALQLIGQLDSNLAYRLAQQGL
jgi:hypothetical protein